MMAGFYFYFSSCLLLLLALNWRTSTGLPVRTERGAEKCAECALLFKDLLLNITELRNRTDLLCFGILTAEMEMSQADTVLACAPNLAQNSGCMMETNSSFSESECMRNIMKDLAYYAAVIESYLSSTLRSRGEEVPHLSPTLGVIQSLRKNCSLMPDGEDEPSEVDTAQMWSNDSFSNRQKMCKIMKGFHVRTITINRAIGYIASGEHRE
ncbi:interleukin-12 subunit alpha [Centropristis striata]|uniref:interleukin-12 subunit alpha n=1 Tax=Centropristis striata TaxID=184440 RepID=UPI0027E0AAB7|nr:interleukin-12 subunit alpha [Centropristis striata]